MNTLAQSKGDVWVQTLPKVPSLEVSQVVEPYRYPCVCIILIVEMNEGTECTLDLLVMDE